MSTAAEDLIDHTYYPVEDHVGEPELQTLIRELLRPLLAGFLTTLGRVVHVGSDQFLYWGQFRPTDSIAPDIYVLPGVPQEPAIVTWKTWEHGISPCFALEVVSSEWEKDYRENPSKYDALGVDELVIFDPAALANQTPRTLERVPWQVYRRRGARLEQVERTSADRVRCETLDCWLRVVGPRTSPRLRIGVGLRGDELFPTGEEREREAKEREREAKEREREAKEREREAKERERARARTFLRRLLEQRFGPLDAASLARLEAADGETLERFGERLLTAAELGDVFVE